MKASFSQNLNNSVGEISWASYTVMEVDISSFIPPFQLSAISGKQPRGQPVGEGDAARGGAGAGDDQPPVREGLPGQLRARWTVLPRAGAVSTGLIDVSMNRI